MRLSARSLGLTIAAFLACALVAPPAFAEKHASYLVDLDDLDGKSKLEDGDKILVQINKAVPADRVPEGWVKIQMRTPRKLWYKGIMLFDKGKNNSFTKVCELTEAPPNQNSSQVINFKDIQNKALVLSKAKAFGVHANVYQISDAATEMKPNHVYTFIWYSDN